MCELSTEGRSREVAGQSTLWPAASLDGESLAKTSVRRAKAQVSNTANEADFGARCSESSEKSDRDGYSLRTSLLSELAELTSCSLIWSRSATPAGRSWWVLGRSARRTDGIGSGSSDGWATPSAAGFTAVDVPKMLDRRNRLKESKKNGNGFGLTLEQQIAVMNWPTPRAEDSESCGQHADRAPQTLTAAARLWPTQNAMDADRGAESKETKAARGEGGLNLISTVKEWQTPAASMADAGARTRSGNRKGELLLAGQVWATPAAQDAKNDPLPPSQEIRDSVVGDVMRGLPAQTNSSTNGKSRGSLNSAWVGSLMGFPVGWTDL